MTPHLHPGEGSELTDSQGSPAGSGLSLATILDSITDGFAAFDLEWRIRYVNVRAEEILRPLYKSKASFLGLNHWEAFPDAVGTPIEENYRRAMREQVTVEFEVYYEPLEVWFDIRAYPSPTGLSVYFQDVTARKTAQEALRQQHEWFEVTLASIGDAVITTDTKGKVTFLNPVAETMTGWKTAEAFGQPIEIVFKIVNEETRQPCANPVAKVLREGRVVGLANHTSLLARDGREVAIEDSAAPIRNANGEIAGVVMVFHDVTNQRRAEDLVRESEEELRALANSIPQLAWMADRDGNIFWYNRRWYDYTGTTFEAMQGWGWQTVHDPKMLPAVVERWKFSIETGKPFEMEFPLRGADGEFRWFLTRVSPVRDSEGRVARWFGTNTDVDTVRRAQEEMARRVQLTSLRADISASIASNAEFQSILQRCTELLVKYLDAAFARIWTLNEEENTLELKASAGLYRHVDGPHSRVKVGEFKIGRIALSKQPHLTNDVQHDPNVSDQAWARREGMVAFAGYPLVVEGRVLGVIALFARHELTSETLHELSLLVDGLAQWALRRSAEEALRESERRLAQVNADLDQKVQERTMSLQRAVAQLEEFSYSISHDLRAPIRAIDAYSQFLKADFGAELPQGAVVFLEKIQRNTQRMNQMINDVLTLSRVSRAEIRLHPVGVQALVEEIVEQHPQMQLPAARIEVAADVYVIGDEISLSQAVSNLLTNAIKFVAPGRTPEVRVRCERRGEKARVWVEDNGIGIPPEHQGKLFGMFERLQANPAYEGTGVGLAIVKKAVERMGGTVGMESDGVNGSRFWVELNRAKSEGGNRPN